MDKMAIVRSLAHESSDHFVGTHWIMTGYAVEPFGAAEERAAERRLGRRQAQAGPTVRASRPMSTMVGGDLRRALPERRRISAPATTPFNLERRPVERHPGPQPRAGRRALARAARGSPLPPRQARPGQTAIATSRGRWTGSTGSRPRRTTMVTGPSARQGARPLERRPEAPRPIRPGQSIRPELPAGSPARRGRASRSLRSPRGTGTTTPRSSRCAASSSPRSTPP